jgi:hypothetical protein
MDLAESDCGDGRWIQMAQDKQWLDFVLLMLNESLHEISSDN